jgi:hypothetical protein
VVPPGYEGGRLPSQSAPTAAGNQPHGCPPPPSGYEAQKTIYPAINLATMLVLSKESFATNKLLQVRQLHRHRPSSRRLPTSLL